MLTARSGYYSAEAASIFPITGIAIVEWSKITLDAIAFRQVIGKGSFMKMTILSAINIFLISVSAQAKSLTIESGGCRLESSGENIAVKAVDPNQHYGLFAEGLSKDGYRIYLTENFQDSVDINFQAGDSQGYSIISLSQTGVTPVRSGVTVKSSAQNGSGEWLSCDMTIRSH